MPDGADCRLALVCDHHWWPEHRENWGEGAQMTSLSDRKMPDLAETFNAARPDLSIHAGDVISAAGSFFPTAERVHEAAGVRQALLRPAERIRTSPPSATTRRSTRSTRSHDQLRRGASSSARRIASTTAKLAVPHAELDAAEPGAEARTRRQLRQLLRPGRRAARRGCGHASPTPRPPVSRRCRRSRAAERLDQRRLRSRP